MKTDHFISPNIYLMQTRDMGLGVFSRATLKKNTLIEISPVLVMSKEDRIYLDQTLLHDYIFEWGEKGEQCCMALGYVPIYNHSYHSNCEYEMIFGKKLISVKTVRAIEQGEELFINYNGNWNNEKKLWFDAK